MMSAEVQLDVNSGSDFAARIQIRYANSEAMSLVGFTGRSTVRKYPESTVVFLTPGIAIENNANVILSVSANTSANIVYGTYYYDVVISNATSTIRILEGPMTISSGTSK